MPMKGRDREQPGAPAAPIATEDPLDRALEQLLVEVGKESQPQPHQIYAELRGQVAIVTGGATGIGRAITFELARHGAHIAFNYLDDGSGQIHEEAERTAQELRQLEVGVLCRACDVRDPEAVRGFVAEARSRLGGVHILVNNAGIARDRALWRMSDEQWREVLDTNLSGAFHLIRAVAPLMRAQQFGKIVNVSSIHGIRSEFGLANYAASKAGLLGLTRSAAIELGPSNINVNAVAPGYIRTTRLAAGVPAEVLDRARERTVLSRLGDPQDVAHVVIFLCSEMARHITGVTIPVDGGHLL
jgi:NAD(P)-dependent dehydrogenase (short-subunit alcohol dehydrogenase family)